MGGLSTLPAGRADRAAATKLLTGKALLSAAGGGTYVPKDVTRYRQWEVIMFWARILLGVGFGVCVVTWSAHAEVRIGAATPLTGPNSWTGEQHERGVALAVAELNEAGGLLGEPIELIVADDYCDGQQAVAAARKLIAEGVVFVAGHLCSGPPFRLPHYTRRPASS
jgi:ABC-type branched-subunit amino acid transport system substrate-binding protein